VSGVPAFLINGKLVLGAKPFETFQQEIEAVLQGSSN
jgi:predicted DsbA family dithiol-disulfide isomerase